MKDVLGVGRFTMKIDKFFQDPPVGRSHMRIWNCKKYPTLATVGCPIRPYPMIPRPMAIFSFDSFDDEKEFIWCNEQCDGGLAANFPFLFNTITTHDHVRSTDRFFPLLRQYLFMAAKINLESIVIMITAHSSPSQTIYFHKKSEPLDSLCRELHKLFVEFREHCGHSNTQVVFIFNCCTISDSKIDTFRTIIGADDNSAIIFYRHTVHLVPVFGFLYQMFRKLREPKVDAKDAFINSLSVSLTNDIMPLYITKDSIINPSSPSSQNNNTKEYAAERLYEAMGTTDTIQATRAIHRRKYMRYAEKEIREAGGKQEDGEVYSNFVNRVMSGIQNKIRIIKDQVIQWQKQLLSFY